MKSWFLRKSDSDSTNRRILRAAVIVGGLTLAAKFAGGAKELFVARSFGRSDALDAFLIAVLLPTFVVGLVMGGLESALIPTFITVRQKQGREAAQKLFSSVLLLSLLLLGVIAALLGVMAPSALPYLGSGFSPAKLRLTRELLYVVLPFILFNGMAKCVSAVLNAEERFSPPALTPLVTPLLTMLFIASAASRWGPFSLAVGTVAGSFVETAILIRSLRKHGFRFTLRWSGWNADLRMILRQYAPMLAGAFLMGGTSVVDLSMAAMLPAGSVAALSYASKIVTVLLAIGATGLNTAALPYFSKMVADNDWSGCRHTLKRYFQLIACSTIPLTLGLIAFSKPLVRLLYQRGAFIAADTELVSWVQICYAIQIPFYVWNRLPVRFLAAARRNDLLMYASAISLVLDIVFNLALMRVWGVAGIALSTSFVYICTFIFLTGWSIKLLNRQDLGLPAAQCRETVSR